MQTEDYISAFDTWLSQHIYAATTSGKDLAFKERHLNCDLKLDDGESVWDCLLIDPGSLPPTGHVWTVYRLHGVYPFIRREEPQSPAAVSKRKLVEGLAEALFGQPAPSMPPLRTARPALRLVT